MSDRYSYRIKGGPLDGEYRPIETDYPTRMFGIREHESNRCHIYRLSNDVWVYAGTEVTQ